MKKISFLFLFLFFIFSCSNNHKQLQLIFDNVTGLTTGATLTLNGLAIGTVTDMKLTGNQKILVTADLEKELDVPADSKFVILSIDLLGAKGIIIQPGNSTRKLNPDDTVQGILEAPAATGDTLITAMLNEAQYTAAKTKTDSLLKVLRKLGRALEKQNSETRSIPEIIAFIDSLYSIKPGTKTDTINDYLVLNKLQQKGNRAEMGPKGLDLKGISGYYRHATFIFVEFKDDAGATKQFDKIVKTAKAEVSDVAGADAKLYERIFSKAGSAYIRYGNVLICHMRRCSYNEKIETPREEQLLSFLFNGIFPSENYFVRVKCGYDNAEIK